jgi:hypothetical protein
MVGTGRRKEVERRDRRRVGDGRQRFAFCTKRLWPETGVVQFHFFEPVFSLCLGKLSF